MLLYPTLAAGFAFIAVPLLVHLINLLRHRKTKWAAMDFLLASYRKQRKWIVLRQFLLLLSRLALAAVLIALLAGWIGGKQIVGVIGGQTTHHVVVIDDSYSMRQIVAGGRRTGDNTASEAGGSTAYDRALAALSGLTARLAADDGEHQLTVLRASRSRMVAGDGNPDGGTGDGGSADMAADMLAQTITGDGRQIERVMGSRASSLRCDLTSALDLATQALAATPADTKTLYVISDFSRRDWASTQRIKPLLTKADQSGATIRMIDCAGDAATATGRNLAVTDLSPQPDVWVAGVPVVMSLTIRNYSPREIKNVAVAASVITYGDEIATADPTAALSGEVQPLPAIMIDSIPGGEQLTKTFQVFIDQQGTHVVRVSLPEDALAIDNDRVCTLPLADAQRVLIIDGDADATGAYLISSVLDPGSQIRLGAIPETQPVDRLRDLTAQTLANYRAVYLVDIPDISASTAQTLRDYVAGGGGLAWFLGDGVNPLVYNDTLWTDGSDSLLPFRLDRPSTAASGLGGQTDAPETERSSTPGVAPSSLGLGPDGDLLGPIAQAGNGVFSLVNMRTTWRPDLTPTGPQDASQPDDARKPEYARDISGDSKRFDTLLARADGLPVATRHSVGRGRVMTVTSGFDPAWNNWSGDPTFVVFLLQTNAMLFSGATPPTSRIVDSSVDLPLPPDSFLPTALLLPPSVQPPRLAIEVETRRNESSISISPQEFVVSGQNGLDELLTPGVIEWQRTATDGRTSVLPAASVIDVGESDLARVPAAEIIRDLLPLNIEFLSAADWQNNAPVAGLSTFLLILLILLAILLAIEQILAAWASYHVRPNPSAAARRDIVGGGLDSSAAQARPRGRPSARRTFNTPAESTSEASR